MRIHWLAISFGLTAAQCGGIARTTGQDLCLAGQRAECSCGRTSGVQTCNADGIGYGECICSGGTGGGGGIDDDAGGPPAASCTSKSVWTGGLTGSELMTPGRACIACHATTSAAPQYTVAGTIYAGAHDPDDCNGVDPLGVAVAFLDDSGVEFMPRLQLNQVGTFFSLRAMPKQYRVKTIANGRESAMQAPVTNGDCNLCHTASGTSGASGRMLMPMP